MKLFFKILFSFALLIFSSVSFALELPVSDATSVTVPISKSGVTRIGVENDRIVEVVGDYQGQNQNAVYAVQSDKGSGDIFITPEQSKPFSIMLKTENGHFYTLRLLPTNSASNVVMLAPEDEGESVSLNSNNTPMPYIERITTLMKAMVTNRASDHYALINIEAKPHFFSPGLTLRLVKLWQGLPLSGEIYQIQNGGKTRIHLHTRDFSKPNVVAVALSKRELFPKQTAWVYTVVRHG